MNNSKLIGITFKVLNLLIYTLISTFIKALVPNLSIFQIMFVVASGAVILLYIGAKIVGHRLAKIHWLPIAVGGISMLAMSAWGQALKSVELSLATAIGFLTPIFAALISQYGLKEQGPHNIWYAIVLGIVGGVIIVRPTYQIIGWQGVGFCLLSALLWAVHDNVVRYQQLKGYDKLSQILYIFLAVAGFSMPLAVWQWQAVDIGSMPYMGVLCGLFCLNMFCLVKAVTHMPLIFLAPISFLRLVFAAGAGYLFFSETLPIATIMGSIVIIGAMLWVYKSKS